MKLYCELNILGAFVSLTYIIFFCFCWRLTFGITETCKNVKYSCLDKNSKNVNQETNMIENIGNSYWARNPKLNCILPV